MQYVCPLNPKGHCRRGPQLAPALVPMKPMTMAIFLFTLALPSPDGHIFF
jgi:hypothetical protein